MNIIISEPWFSIIVLVSRICLGLVFLISGVHKIIWFDKAVVEFNNAGVNSRVIVAATAVLHFAGSLGLISGVLVPEFSLALAIFTVIATVQVHNFWAMEGSMRLERSRVAFANLAIVGGLLLLAATGPGHFVL